MSLRLLSIILIALGLHASASAGGDKDRFRRLSVNDGLSQNSAFHVIQDEKGYVWIGTQDGLNRYDGYDFEVYKHDPDDPNSLSENWITALHADAQGNIWVGTLKSGLNRFDPVAGEFEHFRHDDADERSLPPGMVMAIGEDTDGRIWIGTHDGLSRLDGKSGDFTTYRHDPERARSLGGDMVTTIVSDSRGHLWVGTWEGGLSRYVEGSDDFEVHDYDPVDPTGIPDPRVTTVFEDREGEIWVGTANGLSRFDRTNKTFETHRNDPDDPNSLSSNSITSIIEDGSGAMWVGTHMKGLNRWDAAQTRFDRFEHDPDDAGSLSHNSVISLLEDRSGVIWVGTALGGINQIDRHRGRFEHLHRDPKDANSLSDNTVWSVHESKDGGVWIGTNSAGLVKYDRTTGRFTRIRPEKSGGAFGLEGTVVRAILEDGQGRIWLATNAGVEILRPGSGVVKRFDLGMSAGDGIRSNFVSALIEDSRGRVWIGGNEGIDWFDPEAGSFSPLYQGGETGVEEGAEHTLVLYEDSRGRMWAGTRLGLTRFDLKTGRITRYKHNPDDKSSISNNIVYTVHEDDEGFIWAGTFGGGLNRLEVKSGEFVRWTEQNSELPTNTVFGVLADDGGYLWLSTHRGLTRFDPEAETFRSYGAHHGVQSPEFNSGAFHRGKVSGDLFFGGINGVNIVEPGSIDENPNQPDVLVTGVLVESMGEAVSAGAVSGGLEDGAIRLDHDENDLSIDYVGLHYSLPERNEYAYMLENYDQTWRYVGGSRRASYTNLDPGSYRFRVKAASADGVWNDAGATLDISIAPPWWQTTVAYVGYLALFVLGVFLVDTVQRRRLIRQEREKAAIREAQLRAKALEIQNERQARELEEARELQLSMLPRMVPDHPAIEVEAYMKTATEVGGDYYDFHIDREDRLTIAIGDATDHGARAGTMVTAAKSLFNILAGESDLEAVMQRATSALKRMHLGKLYMAMALIKVHNDRIQFAGAGMPAALVYRTGTGEVEEVSLSGMPLGSLLNYPYQVETLQLREGDTVLLMSDGFAERFDGDGEMFGYDRARDAYVAVAGRSPAEIIDHLVRTSEEWANGAPLNDDMTFVAMRAKTDISNPQSA